MSTATTDTSADGDGSDTSIENSTATTSSSAESDRSTSGDLSKDTIFGLLKVQRRREVVEYLHTVSDETTLSDMAEHIAAKENECEIAQLSANERKCVYVALYQCHLPKMDDAGIIDFNQQRGTIKQRERAAQLLPYLYLDPEGGIESGRFSGVHELARSVYLRFFR